MKSKLSKSQGTAIKRPHQPIRLDDVLDDDLRLESKKAKKIWEKETSGQGTTPPIYDLKPSMLSNNLRQKFAHLFE